MTVDMQDAIRRLESRRNIKGKKYKRKKERKFGDQVKNCNIQRK